MDCRVKPGNDGGEARFNSIRLCTSPIHSKATVRRAAGAMFGRESSAIATGALQKLSPALDTFTSVFPEPAVQ